jgi:hypothetical protein
MSYTPTNDGNVPRRDGLRQLLSSLWANALLIGGAAAVVMAMAGWLYFLGSLGWKFTVWLLS